MATLREITDPYLGVFTSVPRRGPGVCRVCRRPITATYDQCFSCFRTTEQVSHGIDLVVPISLYLGSEQLHRILRGYKDPAAMRLTRAQGKRFQTVVAAAFARFVLTHEHHIRNASGDARRIDLIVPIPSSRGRPGDPPLFEALSRVPALEDRLRPVLTPGSSPIRHLEASDHGFAVNADISAQRVLIADDTLTSGAAVQSAASAIHAAGASVVAAVVVGRYVTMSEEHGPSASWWAAQRKKGFSFDSCCLE